MKNLNSVFLGALMLMLASTADAQQGRRPSGGRPDSAVLNALDKDGDGEISTAELNAASAALKQLDKNRDGEISQSEIRPQFGGSGRPSGGSSGRPSGGGRSGPGGRSDGNESLGSLKVGSTLPDVKVYDGSGKELSTKDLRGKYAVLVFGCLT